MRAGADCFSTFPPLSPYRKDERIEMELLNHTAKEQIVKEYLKKFSIDTFIETGTYEGLMALAIAPHVKWVYTVELDEKLHDFAKRNLKDIDNVCEYHGDSGELLPQILSDISVPRLFWLDAHYSGGVTAKGETNTPILKELEAILTAPYDQLTVILIDDAREYVGKNDYPTQGQLKDMIHKVHPDWVFEVKDDIIRIHPKADFISMSTLGSFGQFGNQLFQYATLKACARCHNLRLEIPEDWIGRKVFLECNDEL